MTSMIYRFHVYLRVYSEQGKPHGSALLTGAPKSHSIFTVYCQYIRVLIQTEGTLKDNWNQGTNIPRKEEHSGPPVEIEASYIEFVIIMPYK